MRARYGAALAPFGRGVAAGAPGDIGIEWQTRAGAERPLSVAYTDLDWEVDGSLDHAAIHVFTDVSWSSSGDDLDELAERYKGPDER